ncbi:hypothetical protein DFH01_03535 [Falsiroseomonas bella]|uniref:Uncharacterized protein n=1 Tax=Falsiroseomonas bella TaxID=2184016 RepID=A0A317FJ69_9PROT|nr:hypothetical protein [Falsiroseomonas bella]PWS38372.1 hypothetical protein DFH01_03535 [Falsiroseomonas bella]
MSQSGTTASQASADLLPDSLFAWVFEATATGNAWGGWLVADSQDYALGATLVTAFGRYTITGEEERGLDLSALGLVEGDVRVEWYRDGATGQFLITRAGSGASAGLGGLGSEVDAVWTSSGWMPFGRGGAEQASVPTDMRFSWIFEADSGDRLWGTLLGSSLEYGVGDTLRTAFGRYRILSEEALAPGDPTLGARGEVRTTRYFDAGTRSEYATRSEGGAPSGGAGLGSELDQVWNGFGWVWVGQGGAQQADIQFSVYEWVFEANSGDRYEGSMFANALRHQAGDIIATGFGRYVILSESAYGAVEVVPDGTLYLKRYFDAGSATWLDSHGFSALRAPSTGRFLGNEEDQVWDGDNFDRVGRGGAWQADIERYSVYIWRFEADSGDRYEGSMFASSALHAKGDVITTAFGRYVIEDEFVYGTAEVVPDGTLYLKRYFDAGSATWIDSYGYSVLRAPSTGRFLGNEEDRVWDGDGFDRVGRGGAWQADVEGYSVYIWRFEANSGDRYDGSMFANAILHEKGDVITNGFGRYVIEDEYFYGTAEVVPDGTLYLKRYFDAATGSWTDSYGYSVLRAPSTGRFLGNEEDRIWDGDGFDRIGRGGALQSDLEGFSVYIWRFEADSGDRYDGSMFANATLHAKGDVITTGFGRYVIEDEYFYGAAEVVPDGTLYLKRYFDAATGSWTDSYGYSVLRGPSTGRFLGNEEDRVWDGDGFDSIGRGGALQSDFEGFSVFIWRFEADSGDRYEGSMFANAARHERGDTVTTAFGRYVIEDEYFYGAAEVVPDGTLYLKRYFDAGTSTWVESYGYSVLRGPSTGRFLGNEEDRVWDGDTFDNIGRGGALQSDFEGFSVFIWRFEADSGDRYEGSMFANAALHDRDDIITTAFGRYVIEDEYFYGTAAIVPDGTLYLKRYFDAGTSTWMDSYGYSVLRGPSTGRFLGNEEDRVWDGDSFDRIGRGGVWQADIEPFG